MPANTANKDNHRSSRPQENKSKPVATMKASTFHADTARSCSLCSADHTIQECAKFRQMEIADRAEHVKSSRKCFNCLGEGHMLSNCQSKWRCELCNRNHHTLLHRIRADMQTNSPDYNHETDRRPAQQQNTEEESSSYHAAILTKHNEARGDKVTLLATALFVFFFFCLCKIYSMRENSRIINTSFWKHSTLLKELMLIVVCCQNLKRLKM